MAEIEPLTKPVPAVPTSIRVRLRPLDPQQLSLDSLVLLDRWSPFVAACVLLGLTPAEIDHDLGGVEAVWEIDPDNEDASLEHYERDRDYSQELRKLTEVIAVNAAQRGEQDVSSPEIVAWAIKTHTLSSDSKVARAFDRNRFEEIYATAVEGGTPSEDSQGLRDPATEGQTRCR